MLEEAEMELDCAMEAALDLEALDAEASDGDGDESPGVGESLREKSSHE